MNNSNFERVIKLAAQDTTRGSRVAAKVFYRILRKNGFSENQIIDIATNILSCLTESLKGYEQKMKNVKEHKETKTQEVTPKKEKVAGTSAKFRKKYDHYGSGHYSANI